MTFYLILLLLALLFVFIVGRMYINSCICNSINTGLCGEDREGSDIQLEDPDKKERVSLLGDLEEGYESE